MYTPDNVHFFDTKKQLERWVAGQRKQQPLRIQSPQEQTTTTLQTPKRSKLTSFRVFSDDDGSLDFWSEDGNETASFLPTPREIQPTQPTKIKKFNVDDVVIYVSPLTGKEKEGRVIAPADLRSTACSPQAGRTSKWSPPTLWSIRKKRRPKDEGCPRGGISPKRPLRL